MDAPQDEIPHTSNQETPSHQTNVPDPVTADAALKDATVAFSQIGGIFGPVQSAASAIGDADNPTGLLDFVSSFLNSLSKFNDVVDEIAKV